MRLRILIVGLTAILLTAWAQCSGCAMANHRAPAAPRRRAVSRPGRPPPTSSLRASPVRRSTSARSQGTTTPGRRSVPPIPSVPAFPPIPRITRRPRGRCDAHSSCGQREIRPPWSARGARQRPPRVRHRPGSGPSCSSHGLLLGRPRTVSSPTRRPSSANLAAATEAIQHMLDLRPGLAAYARASYDLEQQGRLGDAVALMRRALGDAVDPADIAFCRYQLGELALARWTARRCRDRVHRRASRRPCLSPPARRSRQGRRGPRTRRRGASDYADSRRAIRRPGTSWTTRRCSRRRPAGARRQQLALAAAALRLYRRTADRRPGCRAARDRPGPCRASGARGQARVVSTALRRRRRHARLGAAPERRQRRGDLLCPQGNALGAHNSGYLFHLGMIELSLGRNADARRDLSAALALNPRFSPLDAPAARRPCTGSAHDEEARQPGAGRPGRHRHRPGAPARPPQRNPRTRSATSQ